MSRSLGQYQAGAEDKRTLHLGGGLKAERDIQKCMVACVRLHGLTTQMFICCIYLQQCGLVQHQTTGINTKCNTVP